MENGADIQNRTAHGERPREIALRYQHPECVDFLDWAGRLNTHPYFLKLEDQKRSGRSSRSFFKDCKFDNVKSIIDSY